VLGEHLGLRGLFGCDFRLEGNTPWLLEINPRYTGSVELFEWALQRPLLRDHALACGFPKAALPPASETGDANGSASRLFAKRVVYATQMGVAHFPDDLPPWSGGFIPSPVADIPVDGQPLRPGDPICSIFASGTNPVEIQHQIRNWLSQISAWIGPP